MSCETVFGANLRLELVEARALPVAARTQRPRTRIKYPWQWMFAPLVVKGLTIAEFGGLRAQGSQRQEQSAGARSLAGVQRQTEEFLHELCRLIVVHDDVFRMNQE